MVYLDSEYELVSPTPTENPDDGMDDLERRARQNENIVIPCPVCDKEASGSLSMDGDCVRWDCPDCGPCNLTWDNHHLY